MLIPLLILFTLPAPSFEIKDGDRIVMVGGALVEREQQFGYIEVVLHSMFPDRKFTIRNLGWSGDTVWGEARAGFGSPADGYRALVEQVKAARPTILILGYGTSEAFAGKAGLEKFSSQYRKLLDDINATECKCFFLTVPAPQVKVTTSFTRADYNQVIHAISKPFHGKVISLDKLLEPVSKETTHTDDGILPNARGYLFLAEIFSCLWPDRRQGTFSLDQWESIRKLIVRKNELYFHQYRPQNNTYLFLFRKHEQGNNAKEIPQFEPLIAELDAKINELKQKK